MTVLELTNVSLEKNDKNLLTGITWKVSQGEHWAILGANGAGKTMLLNILNGYQFPTRGEVTVTGKTFGEYDLRETRKSIGYVSSYLQEQMYRNETALEVVVSGLYASIGLWEFPSETDYAKSRAVMEEWGCMEFAERKYQFLSQGEKQKVLICRALVANPALMILDEPCVGLDIRAREHVLSMIEEVGRKPDAPTLLLVTHHVEEIMPVFSHVLLLKEGAIHASGFKEAILTGANLSSVFDFSLSIHKKNGRYMAAVE